MNRRDLPCCPVCLSAELVEMRHSINGPGWARYRCGHVVRGFMAAALRLPSAAEEAKRRADERARQVAEAARIVREHVGGMRLLYELGLAGIPYDVLVSTLTRPETEESLQSRAAPL
ncbi:hypothetical protein [Planomonospora sp. ID82291]|uniref:hypothetical protein n=1 Tax=Planomonospora sp. ID82291 TaxID=2738136 RepID=UPI0018C35C02|nr:hypothetical protein [Planomonospora sp. ID82291]MBG0818949.1 hypothetical protein [Planomonospora sp. ID82291]